MVELQRTVMKLRAKLKSKEDAEDENAKLLDELNEYRNKFIESQRKQAKALDQVRELQFQLDK